MYQLSIYYQTNLYQNHSKNNLFPQHPFIITSLEQNEGKDYFHHSFLLLTFNFLLNTPGKNMEFNPVQIKKLSIKNFLSRHKQLLINE